MGNRKLSDGNMCKDCAALLSHWFDGRRHATIDEINEQFADIPSVKGKNKPGSIHFPEWIFAIYGIAESVYQLQVSAFFAVCQITGKTHTMESGREYM